MPKVGAADVAWSKSPPGIHDFRVVAMPHHKCVVDGYVDWRTVQGFARESHVPYPHVPHPYDAGIVIAVIFDPRRRQQRRLSRVDKPAAMSWPRLTDPTRRLRIAVKRAFTPR
jgi:hypothetical protein